MTSASRFALALALVAAPLSATAQTPAFEVVSVKESPPPVTTPGGGFSIAMGIGPRPGGRWIAQNATLLRLIQDTYGGFSMPGQIAGAPEWASRTRFEVNALAAGEPPPVQMKEMVKAMLADRFGLKTRIESREVDVYALVLARSDGTLGSGIKPSSVDCDALAAARKKGELPPPARPQPGQRMECGVMSTVTGGVQKLMFGSQMFASVVSSIQSAAGRPVIDRTGVTGRFDVDLEHARQQANLSISAEATTAPSIFAAVQEQLGMKLEPSKEKMDVLVIEHVQMPTPD